MDGERREEKTAKQYVVQVRSLLKTIDPENSAVSKVTNTRLVRDNWLAPLEKSKRPGTCKAYLGSLSKFLRFLIVEKPNHVKIEESQLRAMKEQTHEWMASYKKPIARRSWEKKLQDAECLISPEEIRAFDVSEPSRKATKLLEEYSRATEISHPTQTDYTLVRDFFLTTLCINNA